MSDTEYTSRSEVVRARRAKRLQREQKRKKPKSAPAEVVNDRSAHQTPIVMRGLKTELPVQKKKGSKVRRRYDVSLGSPGAELRLPTVPMVSPSWRWLSGLLTVGLLVFLGMMWNYSEFLVQTIEIQGLQRLDAREVHLVLGIQNASIFSLDPDVLEYELGRAFPEFQDIDVQIGLPNSVVISVYERLPALGWVNPQGMVLVDKEGISFPARGLVNGGAQAEQAFPIVEAPDLVMRPPDPEDAAEAAAADGFVLNPYVNRELIKPSQVEALVRMSEFVPAGAKIIFDPQHGMGWEDPAGWVVYFGLEGADMLEKLQMYETIVQDMQSRNLNPEFISVEFIHAPYYRMER